MNGCRWGGVVLSGWGKGLRRSDGDLVDASRCWREVSVSAFLLCLLIVTCADDVPECERLWRQRGAVSTHSDVRLQSRALSVDTDQCEGVAADFPDQAGLFAVPPLYMHHLATIYCHNGLKPKERDKTCEFMTHSVWTVYTSEKS